MSVQFSVVSGILIFIRFHALFVFCWLESLTAIEAKTRQMFFDVRNVTYEPVCVVRRIPLPHLQGRSWSVQLVPSAACCSFHVHTSTVDTRV